MKTLFPVQAAHLERLMDSLARLNAAFDGSETGTGKTTVAVELARQANAKLMVVGPKAIGPTWERECAERGVKLVAFHTYEKLRLGGTDYAKKTGRSYKWNVPEDTMVVWDECHKAKSHKSQNALLVATCPAPSLMLSATAANSPLEIRALAHKLKICPWERFFSWVGKYGVERDQWTGGLEFTGGLKYLRAINELLFPERGSKMTRAELREFFPENQVIHELLDFGDDGRIARLYREMEAEIAALQQSSAGDRPSELTILLRARQEVELLKVPVIYEAVENLMDEGKSVAVFVNFNATLTALSDLWGKAGGVLGVISGATSPEERQKAVDAFQADRLRVILVNSAAGGTGLSLHDLNGNFPRVSLISPDWNEKTFEQVLGRIFRAGGKTPAVQKLLIADGTIEERVVRSLTRKLKNLSELLRVDDPTFPRPEVQ